MAWRNSTSPLAAGGVIGRRRGVSVAGDGAVPEVRGAAGHVDADAAAAEELFAEKSGAEVASVRGGQPVYYYIISME